MRFVMTDLNITNHEIKQPVKFVMQKNIYEPYTSASIVFPSDEKFEPIDLNVYDDNSNQLFTGFTDKVYSYMNDDGKYMEVSARSRGALLADNEAIPRSFPYNTFVMNYYETYIQKYGINYKKAINASTLLPTEIYKGSSEWEGLCIIVWFAYGCSPDVDEDNLIVFDPDFLSTTHTFSNSSDNGIKFSQISYTCLLYTSPSPRDS